MYTPASSLTFGTVTSITWIVLAGRSFDPEAYRSTASSATSRHLLPLAYEPSGSARRQRVFWDAAMKVQGSFEGHEAKSTSALVGLVFCWLVGTLLFVPLWAGMNFVFGTALDGPLGAFIMAPPCQRLAGTIEPLRRYTLGTGKVRRSSSVCHFGSGPIRVDGRIDGLGFAGRELAYLVVGFVGYGVCLAGALVLAVLMVRAGRRLLRAG